MSIHQSNFRTKYKNELWNALQYQGYEHPSDDTPILPVADFAWVAIHAVGPFWIGGVIHLPTNSKFEFDWQGEFDPYSAIGVKYAPHPTRFEVEEQVSNWEHVLSHFASWIRALGEESVPDQWEAERVRLALSQTFASDYDSDFTDPEVFQIGESFKAATLEIHQRGLLTTADLGVLTSVMKETHVAAASTPRIQWQTIAATAIVTRLLERGVDTITIKSVLSVVGQALSWLNLHISDSMQHAMKLISGGA